MTDCSNFRDVSCCYAEENSQTTAFRRQNTQNLYGWKDNSMLTNCLGECAHVTITISQIERDIGRKSSFFHTPLHSTPPLGGSRRNITTQFGVDKLEWLGYPMVKKFRRYLYSFWRNSRTCQTDGQTDRHRMPAIAALMHSIARQKLVLLKRTETFSPTIHSRCFWLF